MLNNRAIVFHLDRYVGAEDLKNAAEALTDERPSTKSEALEVIERALRRGDREDALETVLSSCGATELKAWARDYERPAANRDEAVEALLELCLEEEGDAADDGEDDEEANEDSGDWIDAFRADLDGAASADEVTWAAEWALGAYCRRKAEALGALEDGLRERERPRRLLEKILDACRVESLRPWARERSGQTGNKDALIAALADSYLEARANDAAAVEDGEDDEDDGEFFTFPEGDWDDDEDGDDDDDDDDGDDADHVDDAVEARRAQRDAEGEQLRRAMTYSPARANEELYPYQREAVSTIERSLSPSDPIQLHLATGGGKTRVANALVDRWLARHGGPVLWVTKDWTLLRQAAIEAAQRHRIAQSRWGGDNQLLRVLPRQERQTRSGVVYSTVQTVFQRLAALPQLRPTLLVWDECHWGEHARVGKIITACKRAGVPMLGLTGTPRPDSRYRVVYRKTFPELVAMKRLAEPILEDLVDTGIEWTPEFGGVLGDVTGRSRKELGRSRERNRRIVEQYATKAGVYGKTIVFACGIDHADDLARLFVAQGFSARAVHSRLDDEDNQAALAAFKQPRGGVMVLVNVDMLTHGVDVPHTETVFLCRPTKSEILLSQMVGRAARRTPEADKEAFRIVEFTQNMRERGAELLTARQFFGGMFQGARPSARLTSTPRSEDRRRTHTFDATGAPFWIPDGVELPEEMRGLWLREGQSFGIEFELTPESGGVPAVDSQWRATAEGLRAALERALPGRVAPGVIDDYVGSSGDKDQAVWNVEFDGSAGWEVTSRVLVGQDGFREVVAACLALDEAAGRLGLRVSHRTGTHIHLGWRGRDVDEVKRAIRLARLFEPALATLVAPSRVVRLRGGRYDTSLPNEFCRPVSTVFSAAVLDGIRSFEDVLRCARDDDARRVTFNVKPLETIHTVEVRLHSGTLEARKILLWVSLWQQILWAAAHRRDIPDVADVECIFPDGDIVELAAAHLPDARQPQQAAFVRRLVERRREVVDKQWKPVEELLPWVRASDRWSAPPGESAPTFAAAAAGPASTPAPPAEPRTGRTTR